MTTDIFGATLRVRLVLILVGLADRDLATPVCRVAVLLLCFLVGRFTREAGFAVFFGADFAAVPLLVRALDLVGVLRVVLGFVCVRGLVFVVAVCFERFGLAAVVVFVDLRAVLADWDFVTLVLF